MRTTLTVLACALALGGCAIIITPDNGDFHVETPWSGETGNGMLQSETRAISAISAVEVSGPLKVDVQVGQGAALQVRADSNLLPLIHTEQRGDTLRVWVDGNIRTHNEMSVSLNLPALTRLGQNGSGSVSVRELNGQPLVVDKNGSGSMLLSGRVQRLDLHQNGSGQLNASAVSAGTARADLNGSGRLDLGSVQGESLSLHLNGSGGAAVASGNVQSVNAVTYGSGGINLTGVSSQSADVASHGSGDIWVTARQSVLAASHGSGRITVYGNPAQRDISGRHVSVL